MQTIDLVTLMPRAHEAAKAKGFWDVMPDGGQMMMLVISELSEALEGHRKGRNKPSCIVDYRTSTDNLNSLGVGVREFRADVFEAFVKDTVGDEIADAYIRLCDLLQGYNGPVEQIVGLLTRVRVMPDFADELPANFGGALLQITSALISMYEAVEEEELDESIAMAAMAFHGMEQLATREGIDLATHIDLKMRYNATRPVRHGKAY
ncbi:nucleoside triphosphate pyrophosphohydrolase family protein [Hymenobacter mucosus]|uniref:Uncharacterized protein n=1 Tax=Hymenobacter mucosus TaxID=1411120 RepID=A0A239A816_9BACT|nr:hypothetical protein [Hymenobacter mucosus]SNR91806.1 hypothetical protein SAMN06269173_11154 [Hymenobacter mucosus]